MAQEEIPIVAVTPTLSFLYTSKIQIEEPLSVGNAPLGERRIINITGGSFHGPRLSGYILPGGADWQILRNDGTAEVEARYTLKTDDGALIYISNWGYRHGPLDVMNKLSNGQEVNPKEYYFRTSPKFETGSEEYFWLNNIICVAAGERRANEVIITVYEVK